MGFKPKQNIFNRGIPNGWLLTMKTLPYSEDKRQKGQGGGGARL